jgi:hypothetical protein
VLQDAWNRLVTEGSHLLQREEACQLLLVIANSSKWTMAAAGRRAYLQPGD